MKNIDVNQIIEPTEANESIPYIITPRNTFLDTRKPTIRWNKVLGATSYLVKIVRDSEVVWTTKVEGTEFKSNDDLPLKSGVTYSLIIESDNGYSSEMDPNKSLLEIMVLDDQEILDVSNEIAQEEKEQESRDEDKTLGLLLLADIYRKYGLNAKAIEILEGKAQTNNSILPAAMHLELGDFYGFVGLYLSAQEQYQKSLSLIKGEQDLKVAIAATANLMAILTLSGNQDEAEKLKTKLKSLEAQSNNSQSNPSMFSLRRQTYSRTYSLCCNRNRHKTYAFICNVLTYC